MPPFLISLLAKIGPYAAAAAIAFGAGCWVTHRFDLGAIDAAKLQLASQQTADAAAAADWNKKAADFEAQIGTLQNNVQAARQVRQQARAATGAATEAALAAQAAQPGQDGPVAPVLAAEHANLEQMTQEAGK